MDTTAVAIIGKDDDASDVLFLGLRDFPAHKAVLICEPEWRRKAEKIRGELAKFHIQTEFRTARTNSFEDVFRTISEIRQAEAKNRIIINTDTDYLSSCIALSAAFVNGIQAIGVLEDKIIAYPIMKFSYYSSLSDKKWMLLRKIYDSGGVESLEGLGRLSSMSLPLVTYHVRGSRQKPGLEELGLVGTERHGGKIRVMVTTLGNLLLAGHLETPPEEKGKKKSREY